MTSLLKGHHVFIQRDANVYDTSSPLEWLVLAAAGRKECLALLTKIAGDAPVTFRFNHMSPGTGHAPIQLTSDTDSTSQNNKLVMKEIATLAWMWNKQFFADSSKPEVFRLMYSSLTPGASAPQTSEYQYILVEKVLAAAQGKWKPGVVLTKKLRGCMPMGDPGW